MDGLGARIYSGVSVLFPNISRVIGMSQKGIRKISGLILSGGAGRRLEAGDDERNAYLEKVPLILEEGDGSFILE